MHIENGDEFSGSVLSDESAGSVLSDESAGSVLGDEPAGSVLGDEPAGSVLGDEPAGSVLSNEPAGSMFFYGSLCYRALLELVLKDETYKATPADLDDHLVSWVSGQPFPIIEAKPGQRTKGLLVEGLSPAAVAKLNFYEGGFDYALKPCQVTPVGAHSIQRDTNVYFPTPGVWSAGEVWSLEDWIADWGAITLSAAEEVMSYYDELSPQEVATRFAMIRSRGASRVRGAHRDAPFTMGTDYRGGDVDVYRHSRPYSNFFTMEELDLSYRRFDGTMSQKINRAAFIGSDAVIVLPYDPSRDRVMLVEQFRIGPHMRKDPRPWVLEPIAGRIDAGETPQDSAHREAKEEANLDLRELIALPAHYPTPGVSSEYFYPFVGVCDLPESIQGIAGLACEDEDIQSHIISYDRLMELVGSGEATNGPLLLGALWLSQNRDRLRQKYC